MNVIRSGVGMPNEAFLDGPYVMWNHIDGPLLEWAGHMHWLTFRERIRLALRMTSISDIASAKWPHLHAIRERLLAETLHAPAHKGSENV